MVINLSSADLSKGQTMAPGWYKVRIIAFVPKKPKQNPEDSLNYVPSFELETPNKEVLDHSFNSKAIGMMGPFLAAIEGLTLRQYIDKVTANGGTVAVDSDAYVGKKLQIQIVNEQFEGRLVNKIKNFLPYDAAVPF